MQEQEFVCFCLNKRHPNIFMGRRLPSNCRYCNAQFDLMSIIPKAEAEAKGLLKMPEEAAPQPAAEEPAAPQTPAPPAAPAPAGFGMGTPAQSGFGAPTPAQPGFGMGRPAAPAPSGFGMGMPAQSGFGAPAPAQPGFGMGFSAQTTPSVEACQLDFFGEKIAVPQEGGWIGRSAIGGEWFKGNLLISREHVKVVPMAGGRLQIGPDKSLNGVSVTVGGVKKTLGRNETAVLSAGDTLWLYNIPLQLERK